MRWKQPLELVRITALLMSVLLLSFVVYAVTLYLRLPDSDRDAASAVPGGAGERAQWPERTVLHTGAWSAVQGGAPAPAPTRSSTDSGRFRFVGTYFMLPEGPDAVPVRKAVLEDLQQNAQLLVMEQETVDGNLVKTIARDHMVLQTTDGREFELWLRFGEGAAPVVAADESGSAVVTQAWDEVTLETSRFGRRIADDRWILSRNELLAYREELLEDPERLAALFVSMKADRIDRKIEGYRLERQGEDTFWDAIGLRETDVIRRANSMKMSRQERAEYLISEFVANRLNVVVLDIERDGEPQKLIYYLRE